VGVTSFLTDSEGNTAPTPRYVRQAEPKLKRLHRRVSRKQQGSKNRQKARKRLARAYLHVRRQREDHASKLAGTLSASSDAIAYEDVQIHHLVKNRHLAKSISDASWARFLGWVEHDARLHGIVAIAVPPNWTTQDSSGILPDGTPCPERIRTSLSVRTHRCPRCGLVLDRDHNAALNIWQAAAQTLENDRTRTAG
jgi:putative transposase